MQDKSLIDKILLKVYGYRCRSLRANGTVCNNRTYAENQRCNTCWYDLATNGNSSQKLALVREPDLLEQDAMIIDILSNSSELFVLLELSKLPKLPLHIQQKLSRSPSIGVRRFIADSQSINLKIKRTMLKTETDTQTQYLLKRSLDMLENPAVISTRNAIAES